MVTHIVFWKLIEDETHDKEAYAAVIKEKLENLVGKVPNLIKAEVGVNFNGGEYDICLYSQLKDREALDVYANHPEHLKAAAFVRASTCGRVAVDYDSDSDLDAPIDPFVF